MLFEPDRLFSRITAIDIRRDLLDVGLDVVLLDIDNTVRSRETGAIPRDVGLWMAKARDAGVSFCLLSNNWHRDVYGFAAELELPIVAKACKPLPFAYVRALHKIGAKRSRAVAVGDQLFTDVVGAHIAGVRAYMVMPLAEADLKHTLMLRSIERGLIGSMEPEPVPAPVTAASGLNDIEMGPYGVVERF